MQDSPIQIGSINLRGFEVPSSLRFGGGYRLAIHRLASGQRIVERLGPDDNEIRFQGIFSGIDAEARVRNLNNLRLSGQNVWLTWKSFRFQVIIKSFFADYRSPWWIPYEICCVVTDQPGTIEAPSSTLSTEISTDLMLALSTLSESDVQLSRLQSALTAGNAAVAGASDRTNAIAAAQDSLSAINSKINYHTSAMLTANLDSTDGSSYTGLLATAVSAAGSLAAAINARSYLSRINSNLNNLGV